MEEGEIDERLSRLEERLSRLEKRLGVPATPVAPAPSAPVIPPPDLRPPASGDQTVSPVQAKPPPLTPPPLPWRKERLQDRPAQPVLPLHAPGTFESQVGLKWAGWVGAVIVVIGAALGVKYAYDQNWFGALPAAARLALLSLGGFGLIAAGEVVYRRVGPVAAVGLFGAGVATLFVVSYAGYGFFELYERDAAFVLMGIVTLVGAAVAMRGNLVSIAVLSIIGGNIAPLALHSDEPRLVPLLAYLLMLQVVALFLAAWGRSAKWWMLRGVALATICLWLAVPIAAAGELESGERDTVLTFALVYAGLFNLELILSSLRPPKSPTARVPEFAVPVPLGYVDDVVDQRGIGVTFSLLVTASLTIAILSLLRDEPALLRGVWTIGLAGCCLAIGVMLSRLVRNRDPLAPPSSAQGLSIGYRIQAAALVVVAVPVMLSGVWVMIAWAALAVAFALAGASLNLGVSRVAAIFVWGLAAVHLALWTTSGGVVFGGGATGPAGDPMAPWASLLGTSIPAYFVMAALVAVVGHAVASLVREDWTAASVSPQEALEEVVPSDNTVERTSGGLPHDSGSAHNLNYQSGSTMPPRPISSDAFQSIAGFADVCAAIVFSVAALSALPALGTTFALLCYGWALVGVGQTLRSPELLPIGLLLMAISGLKWLTADTIGGRSNAFGLASTAAVSYRPVYNPVVAVGAALFVTGLALMRVPLRFAPSRFTFGGPNTTRASAQQTARVIGGFGAMLVLLWVTTMEVDRYFNVRAASASDAKVAADFGRTKQVVISVVWSVYAVGCVALGFAVRVAGLRYFGLALFALTVVKVMVIDLGSVQTGYRILSFLGLGLLLLGTSVLYGKLSPLLLREQPRSPDNDDESVTKSAEER